MEKVRGMRNAEEHSVWSGLNQEKDSHGILFTPVDIGGRPLSYSVTSPAPDVRSWTSSPSYSLLLRRTIGRTEKPEFLNYSLVSLSLSLSLFVWYLYGDIRFHIDPISSCLELFGQVRFCIRFVKRGILRNSSFFTARRPVPSIQFDQFSLSFFFCLALFPTRENIAAHSLNFGL